ncbi:hypothetical protein [Streptomyces sp. NPDC004976]
MAPGRSAGSRPAEDRHQPGRTAARRRAAACAPVHALTRADLDPHDDLAAAQGHAARHSFTVADRIVDTLDGHGSSDDPTLRRGYARALRLLADPDSPVRGIVAVSRISVPPIDRIYEAQLHCIAARSGGLWLVRAETEL